MVTTYDDVEEMKVSCFIRGLRLIFTSWMISCMILGTNAQSVGFSR
jgi:hypothetical protein